MAWHLTQEELDAKREFFFSRVQKAGPDECWLWTGARHGPTGYGYLVKPVDGGREDAVAHRVALQMAGVEVKPTDCVLHSCDVKACCNPAHLRIGTKSDNTIDRGARQRMSWARGNKNRATRLTAEQVVEIRRLRAAGLTQSQLARQFGIAQTNVSAICRGVTWNPKPGPSLQEAIDRAFVIACSADVNPQASLGAIRDVLRPVFSGNPELIKESA